MLNIEKVVLEKRIFSAAARYRSLIAGMEEGRPPCRFLQTEQALKAARKALEWERLPVWISTSTAVRLLGAANGPDDGPMFQSAIVDGVYELARRGV